MPVHHLANVGYAILLGVAIEHGQYGFAAATFALLISNLTTLHAQMLREKD